MNKSSKKMKALTSRLLALLLCCVCLVGVLPVAAFAMDADTTPAVEDIIPEQPKEGGTLVPENDGALVPVPASLTNPDDSSLVLGGNELKTKSVPTTEPTTVPTTEPTAAPTTEPTTVPTTEPTTVPTTEPTTEPTTKLTSTSPNTQTKNIVLAEEGSGETTNPNARAIGGQSNITLEIEESKTVRSNVNGTNADDDHQESWTSDNEAVATVSYNLGWDDKATSATIAGVSEGTATITHNYWTRTWNRPNYIWTSHTETIEVTVLAAKRTVSFNVGTDAITPPEAITVRNGQTVSELPELVWNDENGQPVKVFAGWYSNEALTQEFTTATEVTANTTLYAKWVDPIVVSFDVGEEANKAGITNPSPIKVKSGETIPAMPAEPVWKNESGQYVKVFAGWFDANNTEFTAATPVTADTKLSAKWLEPTAEGVFYANFYSQDAQTVHLTLSALEGKTVAPAPGPVLVDKAFIGWATVQQGDKAASEFVGFDFNTPISDVDTNGTLNLYAWYADSVTVSFVANGGTAVPSQVIAKGETATKPTDPTRTGYNFRGWSTDENTYTPFDFGTAINEDTALYAFWDANMVPVTIVYMYENPNDAEYSPAGKSEKIYAPAGSYISVAKSNVTNMSGSHYVRYADTMDGEFTGYAVKENGNNATIPDISDTYFQYETASNKRWVNPDGSTTVLVYYNRARVTLTFNYDQYNAKGSIDYTKLISEADREKYNVSYTRKSDTSFTYSFTAKYQEDITAVWPQVAWVKGPDGNTASYTQNRNVYTFYGWNRPDTQLQASNMYTLESSLFISDNSGLSIVNGKLVGTGSLSHNFKVVYKDWLIYARTTLPGETADFIYGGKQYTIYKEACQLGYSASDNHTFGYKSLDGCKQATTSTLYTTYSNTMSIGSITVNGGTLKEKFDATFPDQISTGDNCQILPYDRDNLTLSVWTNDDTHSASDSQIANYLYGDNIYNEVTDLLKSLESSMTKEGYVFAGWYTTSEFTPGTEYKPDENSTITANMNLFAKWEPDQYRAEYYLYMDDADPYAEQGFAEGGTIEDKLVPYAVQDSFLGWYWYQNGQLVPFDFTSAVGANHVDENGVLKLYAKWEGSTGKVSYLPGIGGDNATQEVFDSRDFAINEAAVQLPQYTEKWPDGSVPSDKNLTFVGWLAPNGIVYQPGRYITVTRNLMQFEAQWSTQPVTLTYDPNGGLPITPVTETWDINSVVTVWDNMDGSTPHFTRGNYVLLGWDENKNATEPDYKLGDGQTITLDTSKTLYAIWKLNTVTLTVQKTVSGNMYNANDEFNFTLTYEGKEGSPVEFPLQANGSMSFFVPVGAKVTVTETISNGYVPGNGVGTTVTLDSVIYGEGIFKFTMPEADGTLVINNDKTVEVDTGILLDTLPYILILGVVAAGAVLMIKKRRNRDDY